MISNKFKTRCRQPIGLDFGHDSIKMIQLAVNDGRVDIVAAAKVSIDQSIVDAEEKKHFLVSAIKQMLAQGNFRGKDVVSCLPNDSLKITSVRLAELQTQETEKVLQKEVVCRFGFDSEKDVMNYVFAGNVRHGEEIRNEYILFAADNETIKNHIDTLEQANLRPVAIDPLPCALFRNMDRMLQRQEDKDRAIIFVDVGNLYSNIVLGCQDEISFIKQMPVGVKKFNEEIASKLGVTEQDAEELRKTVSNEISSSAKLLKNRQDLNTEDDKSVARGTFDIFTKQAVVDAITTVAENLAREISLCLRYYTVTFRGRRVENLLLSGGGAYENILLNVLKRQLAVEIEIARPLKGFNVKDVNFNSDRRGALCEWAVSVGLGLKGWKKLSGSKIL